MPRHPARGRSPARPAAAALAVTSALCCGARGADAAPAPAAATLTVGPLPAWLEPLFTPVALGTLTLSPARLVLALVSFLALVLLFRLVRRALARTLLDPARIDAGAAHSVDKVLGYAGTIVALLTALSVAGLDITNLAIVAGALSVGVGLGLQGVVNNFVSGLILLAERPVKVGDWIEIKGQRGRIRRINVRATEIETADHAAVFVPNADLVANALTNITPREPRGTAIVRVGVPHSADPDRVRAVLAEAAAGCPELAASPPPAVGFDEIGPSALQFSVRGTVADLGGVGAAETALRTRVVKALNHSGIGIAHPQSDVHLRDLDAVRVVLMRALEERERRARAASAETVEPPER